MGLRHYEQKKQKNNKQTKKLEKDIIPISIRTTKIQSNNNNKH